MVVSTPARTVAMTPFLRSEDESGDIGSIFIGEELRREVGS